MTSDKAAIVVNTVAARTNQGKIAWTATSTDQAFEASFPKETLRIVREAGRDEDGDDYEIFLLEILNSDGRKVDTINPYDVRMHFKGTKSAWAITESIYTLARDRALGVEETVDDLLRDLGGPVSIDDAELEAQIPF